MKPFMVISEPDAYQLLADETRRKMLYLLRVKEMTASQIASELGITSQAVYHHIKRLLKGKMVEVVKEERTGHLIESYYKATAEDFILSHGKVSSKSLHDKKVALEQVTTALKSLNKLGFKLEIDDKKITQLVNLRLGLDECCEKTGRSEVEDKIWNADDMDLPMKMMASDFVGTLLMSDKEFAEQQEIRKRLRALLLSMQTRKEKER
jgi:DNA-binding transcriptional ArsR family regulator